MNDSDTLVGSWTLVRWETRYDDGRVFCPMGEDAKGLLIYAPDGYMAAFLHANNRPPFTTGEMLTATAEEKVRGWDTYFSYAGRYEIDGDRVVHHVEASLYPNWLGTTLVRHMKRRGAELSLTTVPQKSGRGLQSSELIWRRTTG